MILGILPEPDGKQRRLYKERDSELLERREFYRLRIEQYPVLDDVISGRKKFSDKAVGLTHHFERALPAVVRIMAFSGFPKEPYSIPGIDVLIPFVDMLSDLEQGDVTGSVDYKGLLAQILTGRAALYSQKTWDRLGHFFLALTASAVLLDSKVRRSFLDVLVQENPGEFRKEYSRMRPEDREYAEYTLSRMLGAGILRIDQIELERIVWEAREQARREGR